mgnify:CR=1 FL=1
MLASLNWQRRRFLTPLGVVLLLLASPAFAQEFEFPDSFTPLGRGAAGSDKPVTISAEFTAAQENRPALVFVTAQIGEGFHIYALDQGGLPDGGGGPMATQIELAADSGVRIVGPWQPVTPPDTHTDKEIWVGLELREHSNSITWFAPVEIAETVDPAKLSVSGNVFGQACNPDLCVPFDSEFQAALGSGVPLPAGTSFAAASRSDVAKTTTSPNVIQQPQPSRSNLPLASATTQEPSAIPPAGSGSFLYLLGLAFLGGLILNVMPCVLPVIGLKVFAFIEQAGQSRWKIFSLNLWYSLGVISVFMILAVLSIVFQLGWGQLFQYAEFNIAMASIVFAMGLSFMGIWEIPIPGFIGTSKVTDIGRKEGYEGAFAKGTITTLLATPCTGPFMGTALVGVLNRPPWEILSIFFTIGLGMASPYLLIGAFPQLIRFLPKPGEWMNTFKQLMGFVLIGTVVYLLTLLKPHYVVPTVAFLFGIWLASWWIGRVPLTAPSSRRWNALGEGLIAGALIGIFAFYWLAPVLEYRFDRDASRIAERKFEELFSNGTAEYFVRDEPWQPYSERKLAWLLEHGKTVIIDFTADWCPTCKLMEKTVLKTEKMAKVLKDNNVYTLVADWTHHDSSPEVTKKLQELGTQQIPLLAIYSAQNPREPILIPGTYTLAGLTSELLRAGPSLLGDPSLHGVSKQGMAKALPISVR